jgi:hypothetical protein
MRIPTAVAIAIWLYQPAQAQTPGFGLIDVGSASAGGAQVYSAFLLNYRENRLYLCSASYKSGEAPVGRCQEDPAYSRETVLLKGSNVQTVVHTDYTRHALPLGLWQVDQQSGTTQFCIVNPVKCVDVTPK